MLKQITVDLLSQNQLFSCLLQVNPKFLFKILLISSLLGLNLPSYARSSDTEYDAYCSQQGGEVEDMQVIFHTPSGAINGYMKSFCNFEKDHDFLSIGLETYASEKPSIAATYMKNLHDIGAKSSLWKGDAKNPSYNVCKNLGGALIGFVTIGSFTDSLGEADICVFGDGSMVSAWTLIYMANHREGYDEIKNQVKAEPLNIPMPD